MAIKHVAIGVGGAYKVGCWTAASVDVEADPGRLQLFIEAPDPDGNRVTMPGSEVAVERAGTHRLTGLFKVGNLSNAIRIRVVSSEGEERTWSAQDVDPESAGAPVCLKQSAFLTATIGKPGGFDEPIAEDSGNKVIASEPASFVASLESLDQLPHHALGMEAVDLLVLAGEFAANVDESRRIRDWVQAGGNLIVSVGNHVSGFAAGEIGKWLPVYFDGDAEVRDLGVLEGFAGRGARLLRTGQSIRAAKFRVKDGETLVTALHGPLVMRAAEGRGQITLIGVDIDRPPLSDWTSMSHLARRLHGGQRDSTSLRTREAGAALAQGSATEIATQFYRTLDDFPPVQRVSTWSVMGLMLLYLFIIGPTDYFVVHRLLKRPQWTWITFPILVAAATLLATYSAGVTNRSALIVNRLDLLDIDATTDTGQLRSWATVYSPETRRYRVSIEPRSIVKPNGQSNDTNAVKPTVRIAWNGIPEDAFGGMYRHSGLDFGHAAYQLSADGSAVENLPIGIWSTKSLSSTWQGEVARAIKADLSSRGPGNLSGTLQHEFTAPLQDWIVAYGKQVYRPVGSARTNPEAKLQPREVWSVADASPRELEGYLTGTTQRYLKTRDDLQELVREQLPYDKSSRDPGYVLQMLTFFQAAGGKQYTGLENRALRSFDLTPLLGLNRAVLVGRVEVPAAEVRVNDTVATPEKQWTFVRLILPVKNLRISGSQPAAGSESAGNSQDAGAPAAPRGG